MNFKWLVVLCVLMSASALSNAQNDGCRARNACAYHIFYSGDCEYQFSSTKSIYSLIPMYGRTNQKLTLKVYPASRYYDEWMKGTEYPETEYTVVYDNAGLLSSVENQKSISRFVYEMNYSHDSNGSYVLKRVDQFNKLTGERISSKQIDMSKYYDKNIKPYKNRIDFGDDKWFINWQESIITRNGWTDGWEAYLYAYGYNRRDNTYHFAYGKKYNRSDSSMRSDFGLSWKSQVKDGGLLYGVLKKQGRLVGIRCNSAGLPIGNGMGNVNAYQLDHVVRNNEWYEYIWSYTNSY